MDTALHRSLPASSRFSVATLLTCLGLLAVAAGWFLPWISNFEIIGVGTGEVARLDEQAKQAGVPERVVSALRRVRANEAVSGNDFAVIGRFHLDHQEGLDARERRGWTLGLAVLQWAPWVAAAAALLLVLGRMRKPGTIPLSVALTVAILVGGFAALLVLGSSQRAKDAIANDPKILGLGIYTITIGGLGALFAGLFAMRTSNWWKVVPLTLAAVTGILVACLRYVGPP